MACFLADTEASVDKDVLIGLIEARKKKIRGDAQFAGEARALGLALGYIREAPADQARVAIRQMAEAEKRRTGQFWQQSTQVLNQLAELL